MGGLLFYNVLPALNLDATNIDISDISHKFSSCQMLKHAYRGRLRRALVVSAPYAFNGLWHVVKGPTA
jgi:hypothetical protein